MQDMTDEIEDIKGYLDDVADFSGVPRQEAPLQRENVRFVRIYKNIWLGEISANVLIDVNLPAASKTSLIVCDTIVYEGRSKNMIFPRTGVPLPSGRCYIVLHANVAPQVINCAIQKLSAFSVAGSTIEWGGYHINMFDKRFQITNDMRLIEVRKTGTEQPRRQKKHSMLLTTGHLLKDYFWSDQ